MTSSISPALIAALLCASSCKSGGAQKDVDLTPREDDTSMLEESPDRRISRAGEADDELDAFFIPTAADEMALAIDGDPSDWRDVKKRSFEKKRHVIDGRKAWRGKKDASLHVRVDHDQAYLYVQFFVRDDVVLGDGQDSVMLGLRDPKLEAMAGHLPEGIDLPDELLSDVSMRIYPDGEFSLKSEGGGDIELDPSSVTIAPIQGAKGGWGAEVALSIEALPLVASLPVSAIAFRMEVRDGDDKRKEDYQTLLEMLPAGDDEPRRYALLSLEEDGGMLPHLDAKGAVQRADGVGYWRQEEGTWQYVSLERVTTTWRLMQDASAFLTETSAPITCPSRDQEVLMLEAYRTRSGRHRVGLFLCLGQQDAGGDCPREASTQLHWMHQMRSDEGAYDVRTALEVFKEPLAQCRQSTARANDKLATRFTMLPLDFVNANVWAISWREQLSRPTKQYEYLRHAVRFVNARSGSFMGPDQTVLEREDDGRSRIETINTNYFVHIDDDEHHDICEIGRIREQQCSRYQQGCKTPDHSEGIRRYVQLWKSEQNAFKKQLIRHHPNCPSDISLATQEGYVLFHTGSRVGLLPSVLNKEE